MKKLFPLFIVAVILLACSKSSNTNNNNNNNGSQGVFTATIDGTPYNFNVYPSAVHVNANSMYSVAFAGYAGPIGTGNYLEIGVIDEPAPIVAGTYYDNFANSKLNTFIDYATMPGSVTFIATGVSPDTSIVTITSITADSAKGTFSGQISNSTSGTTTQHIITNGKFSLKFSS
jgi:hypothetical protein